MQMNDITSVISRLCDANAVCGREYTCFEYLKHEFGYLFDECHQTSLGSFTGMIKANNDDAKTVLIDAPLDESGFTVTKICGNGFLKVCANGTVDTRTLSAFDVTVFGKKAVNGVFTSTPPHLQSPGDSDKPLTVDSFYIDTGLDSTKCAELINVGDIAALGSSCTELLNGLVTGRLISNKACMAATINAIEMLGKNRAINIMVRFTAGTEVGSKDAKTSITPPPDYAIIIDRANAFVTGQPEYCKNVIQGDGAVISYTAASSVRMTKYVKSTAEKRYIPHQVISQGNGTASDITSVAIATHGAHTCLVELPVKNRFTQSETVSKNDIASASNIICEVIKQLEDGENV